MNPARATAAAALIGTVRRDYGPPFTIDTSQRISAVEDRLAEILAEMDPEDRESLNEDRLDVLLRTAERLIGID
jgi:hypothetical protein